MKKTAVEFLYEALWEAGKDKFIWQIILQQAIEMEKEQMEKVAGDWWNEGASYHYYCKTKYQSFEQYYNETYEKK